MAIPPIDPVRRALLFAIAGTTALGLARASSARVPSFLNDPFTLGVASGSPSADGFVLWTRLMDTGLDPTAAVPVRWEVFEDGSPARVVAAGEELALPALGHAVHAEIAGLEPGRWYGYRFTAGNAVSPQGRTRTLPAADARVDSLRFAYASCQRWESGYYAGYRHMLREQPDLVLFLGDYIYESAGRTQGVVRPHELPAIRTLQDFRQRYALYRSDADLQRMHAACPWLVTWDDHEVENNYAGARSTRRTARFSAYRAAAYQAFYEHMPLRASTMVAGLKGLQSGEELRIYGDVRFGRLARFYLLDNRQYRDPPLCREGQSAGYADVCVQPNVDERSMLGRAQEQWLRDALKQGARQEVGWNFLAQQTAFTPRNYAAGRGRSFGQDSWDGHPATRERLLSALAAHRSDNPVFLGGDIHENWVANVHASPYDANSPVIASEFCGTSLSSSATRSQASAARRAEANPHCVLSDLSRRGYGMVEVRPGKAAVRLRVLDDVADRDSGISTLASFSVASGQPAVQRDA